VLNIEGLVKSGETGFYEGIACCGSVFELFVTMSLWTGGLAAEGIVQTTGNKNESK